MVTSENQLSDSSKLIIPRIFTILSKKIKFLLKKNNKEACFCVLYLCKNF